MKKIFKFRDKILLDRLDEYLGLSIRMSGYPFTENVIRMRGIFKSFAGSSTPHLKLLLRDLELVQDGISSQGCPTPITVIVGYADIGVEAVFGEVGKAWVEIQ